MQIQSISMPINAAISLIQTGLGQMRHQGLSNPFAARFLRHIYIAQEYPIAHKGRFIDG